MPALSLQSSHRGHQALLPAQSHLHRCCQGSVRHISQRVRRLAAPIQSPRQSRQTLGVKALVAVDYSQPAIWLGLGLIAGGLSLYQLRRVQPVLSRDFDIVVSSVVIFSGGILIFQGWRLDPLLLFCQLLTAGTALSWALEAIKLRKVVDSEQRFANQRFTQQSQRGFWSQDRENDENSSLPLPPPQQRQPYDRWYSEEEDAYDVQPEYERQATYLGAPRRNERYQPDDGPPEPQDDYTQRVGSSQQGAWDADVTSSDDGLENWQGNWDEWEVQSRTNLGSDATAANQASHNPAGTNNGEYWGIEDAPSGSSRESENGFQSEEDLYDESQWDNDPEYRNFGSQRAQYGSQRPDSDLEAGGGASQSFQTNYEPRRRRLG